jgi:GTP-binding protein Era
MKSGFVAILGRPNVGKSTLLNALLSKKVSIVSRRAQTTRDEISGILNEKDYQIVFVDTPGLFEGHEALDKYMGEQARNAAKDVDAILYLIDAAVPDLEPDLKIIASLKANVPLFLVINKIDLITVEQVGPLKEKLAKAFPNAHLIEASLLHNFGLKEIKEAVVPCLKGTQPFYPEGALTDKDKAYQCKEVIRQELLHFLKQEVPHQCAVKVDSLKIVDKAYVIHATIIAEKPNHKAIIIGKGGTMIKKISMSARHELERMWQEHISELRIEADCIPGWRNNPKVLKDLGYAGE